MSDNHGLNHYREIYTQFWGKSPFTNWEDGTPRQTIDITCCKIILNPRSSNILLIREEYKHAYEAISKGFRNRHLKNQRGAFVVTGQPGIGKTLFLLYILICRLTEKQPVALQVDIESFILFDESGALQHDGKLGTDDNVLSVGTWGLSDTLGKVTEPCRAFLEPIADLIHTCSPAARNWKEWKKQCNAEMYIMDVWSPEEFQHLLLAITDKSKEDFQQKKTYMDNGRTFFEKYGPSPRKILELLEPLQPIEREQEKEKVYIRELQICASQFIKDNDLAQTFEEMEALDFSGTAPSKIFTLRPSPGRLSATLTIPTKFLAMILGVAVFKRVGAQQNAIFTVFSRSHTGLRSPAGWLYENYCHVHFSSSSRPSIKAVCGEEALTIPAPTTEMRSGSTALKTFQPLSNLIFYWRPRETNFGGIDALIHTGDTVWALQYTISACHRASTSGLNNVYELMNHKKKIRKWQLAIVGPSLSEAQQAAAHQRKFVPKLWSVYACQTALGLLGSMASQELQRTMATSETFYNRSDQEEPEEEVLMEDLLFQ